MENILDRAKQALALITSGRAALDGIRDAIAGGKEALNASDKAELDALLAREEEESRKAHDSLADAIREARAKL